MPFRPIFKSSLRPPGGKRPNASRGTWSKSGWRPAQIVGPIRSTYRWQGKIESDEEWQCWCKTRGELYARVEEAIRALHPYEVPEILAVPVVAGSERYLAWLDAETEGS